MDLNTVALSFLGCVVLYGAYVYWQSTLEEIPKTLVTPWGQQVGKSKLIQSKTGDASLFTEKSRRNTTKNGGFGKNNMGGAIDYFFITRLCVCPLPPPGEPTKPCCCGAKDGGSATNVTDGVYDGGGATTNYGPNNFDGGGANE